MVEPNEISRELVAEGKFLKYENITWQGRNGKVGQWETMERRHDGAEAVLIIPWIVETQQLIIIKQYRPPAKGYVYELPAGLIDAGEDVVVAAKRELREETGYSGEVIGIIDPAFNTPGMSGEAVYSAYMEVTAGQSPEVDLQDSEDISVCLLSRDKIESFMQDEIANKSLFDSKLLMYLYGILTEKKIAEVGCGFIEDLPMVR